MMRLIGLFLAAILALPAQAIERPFPANILRGKFTPGYFPDITLDGKARKLSPAARIFNEDNRIELPAAVRGKDIVVNYTVDAMGYIDRIWILTADEAAQKVPTAADLAK
ncbi:hypothetical protein GTP45_18685 [Pseudoduganella sp. FT55W]|uniref:Uncharacterized protein n=1 Tax=Duganella rivi TaxID=2666083 RepID=A0A7X4GSF7_9BURK|nr:hypothetical protein [Duganella rivi]MYM68847.1 hypothetical protein [Duganella rivi]